LFAELIDPVAELAVATVTVDEVVKKLAREAGDETASMALSLMQRGQVVAVDIDIALSAATNGLPLADSLICATARAHGAVLWTQDADFDGLPGVNYLAKPGAASSAVAPSDA
jgi:predicted nucleic acid-binding protein